MGSSIYQVITFGNIGRLPSPFVGNFLDLSVNFLISPICYLYFWVNFIWEFCMGHSAWVSEGHEGQIQAGPKGHRLDVGAQRAPRLLVCKIEIIWWDPAPPTHDYIMYGWPLWPAISHQAEVMGRCDWKCIQDWTQVWVHLVPILKVAKSDHWIELE